jgi:hypothetical protein
MLWSGLAVSLTMDKNLLFRIKYTIIKKSKGVTLAVGWTASNKKRNQLLL